MASFTWSYRTQMIGVTVQGREEFFIDHVHVFSTPPVVLLAERAGFRVAEVQRLREPSTKFTLRAFLRP